MIILFKFTEILITMTTAVICCQSDSLVSFTCLRGRGQTPPPAQSLRQHLWHPRDARVTRENEGEKKDEEGWMMKRNVSVGGGCGMCVCVFVCVGVGDWYCDIISALINCRNEASCTEKKRKRRAPQSDLEPYGPGDLFSGILTCVFVCLFVVLSRCRLSWLVCCSWVPRVFSAQVGEPSHLQAQRSLRSLTLCLVSPLFS